MIALVRHAGYSTSTGALDTQGLADSHLLGKKLAKYEGWLGVLSSPVFRTKQTAEALAEELDVILEFDPDLGLDGTPAAFSSKTDLDGWVLVSHAPILHAMIKHWAKALHLPVPDGLQVAEAYLIDPQRRIIQTIRRDELQRD